jgi:hypothetical protein
MRSRIGLVAVVLALLAPARAALASEPRAKPDKPADKPAAKPPAARSAPAKAAAKPKAGKGRKARPKSRLNMPVGWVWPPSDDMTREGKKCQRDLDAAGLAWRPGPRTKAIVTPVIVEDMDFGGLKVTPRGKGPHVMDCHLARALVRQASPALRSMKVVELRVGQIHKYRDVAGKKGVLSRHSLGLAMDVYAFVTSDGVVHEVEGGYLDGDTVLFDAEDRITDTGAFRTLLTPGNDPDRHHDHFHFEARAAGDKVVTKPTRAAREDHIVTERPVPTPGELVAPPPRSTAGKRTRADQELEGPPYELEGPPAPRSKP